MRHRRAEQPALVVLVDSHAPPRAGAKPQRLPWMLPPSRYVVLLLGVTQSPAAARASSGFGEVHRLDGLAAAERREVGAQRRLLALLGGRPHDHNDLVASVADIDEFTDASTAARAAHELRRLHAVVARAGRGRVAADLTSVIAAMAAREEYKRGGHEDCESQADDEPAGAVHVLHLCLQSR
jgi:hypothetical protein